MTSPATATRDRRHSAREATGAGVWTTVVMGSGRALLNGPATSLKFEKRSSGLFCNALVTTLRSVDGISARSDSTDGGSAKCS